MEEATRSALAHWVNFYTMVGSSAGALTGLQFVVITLVAESQSAQNMQAIRAFGTPTVVHFCAALLISAIMCVPWDALSQAGFSLAGFGIVGFAYALMVFRQARAQTGYAADALDWFWFVILPFVAYAALITEGILLSRKVMWCLLPIAATSLLFLFLGIRNAWDSVTHLAIQRGKAAQKNRTEP